MYNTYTPKKDHNDTVLWPVLKKRVDESTWFLQYTEVHVILTLSLLVSAEEIYQHSMFVHLAVPYVSRIGNFQQQND